MFCPNPCHTGRLWMRCGQARVATASTRSATITGTTLEDLSPDLPGPRGPPQPMVHKSAHYYSVCMGDCGLGDFIYWLAESIQLSLVDRSLSLLLALSLSLSLLLALYLSLSVSLSFSLSLSRALSVSLHLSLHPTALHSCGRGFIL